MKSSDAIGPYRIVRRVASGGMAEVYLARETGPEGVARTVVLKRVPSERASDEELVTMFLDEARLMAALSHPHIAQVFGLIKTPDDAFCLAMEYVRGPTLRALLDAAGARGMRGLPETEAVAIAIAIAEALAYVHALHDDHGRPLRIVHRDLKPSNVMVSYDGAVKLIDFGIARAATRVYETRTGVIKGTHGYMAPEQLAGRSVLVDHRVDVYALGLLLYELCTGAPAFDEHDPSKLVEHVLAGRFPRPRHVAPDIAPALDALIVRCLAPQPADRPADVRSVIDALAAHLGSASTVPTMGAIASLVRDLVHDDEGPEAVPSLTEIATRRVSVPPTADAPPTEAAAAPAPRSRPSRRTPAQQPRTRRAPARSLGLVATALVVVAAMGLVAFVAGRALSSGRSVPEVVRAMFADPPRMDRPRPPE